MAKRSKIPIKTKQEIVMMREAGKVASDVLQRTAGFIAAGKTTREVDECLVFDRRAQGEERFL